MIVTVQSTKPVNVLLPCVYRYMDKKFVDLFFDEGILRISSYNRFRTYPDEVRGDPNEAKGTYSTKTKEGNRFNVMTAGGSSEYMLSASLFENDILKNEFKVDTLIKITDPINFFAAISNAIVGFHQGFIGFCNYQDIGIVEKKVEDFSIKEFENENGELMIGNEAMHKRMEQMVGSNIDLFFLKRKKYQSQVEFRFVWQINSQYYPIHEYIDVNCKEALQYCEKEGEAESRKY